MRQVPRYLLIGSGRVACHIQHYFSLLQLSFTTWDRKESLIKLYERLTESSHVLLLISDEVIDEFIAQHIKNFSGLCIHFAGSLVSEHAHGAHPLTSFNTKLYDLEQYLAIPFIIDDDAPEFDRLLPGLPNQHARLHKSLKAKYHALSVMSGNFSCMLWQKFFSSLEQEFNLPSSIAHSYLRQITQNLLHDPVSALTGPLVRNDINTIEKNVVALNSDPFQNVYKSFVECYEKLTIKN